MKVIRPQAGPQERFLACGADVVIYGGAAGGGKTFALLLDLLRAVGDPHFRAVVFRRVTSSITAQKGLLDESRQLYPYAGGHVITSPRIEWRFPSGAKIQFNHLQFTKNLEDHKGAQYTAIHFDELTEFEEEMFWYLFSRRRSPDSQWRPWVRASTNPDASSWVRRLLDWWIDPETGYAIPERSGVIRYLTREGDTLHWVDESWRSPDGVQPVSFTFISAALEDNRELLRKDPLYRQALSMLSRVEHEKLAKGNWNITQRRGIFAQHTIDSRGIHPARLPEGLRWVRYWDLANTEPHERNPDPDWTAGALCALHTDERGDTLYIRHMAHARLSGARKREWMRSCATTDGFEVEQWIEEEGGATGSEAADDYATTHLSGFAVRTDRPSGSKTTRANRWLPLAERSRVVLVQDESGRLEWAANFLSELGSFPFGKRDQVDAVSGAYAVLKSNPPLYYSF